MSKWWPLADLAAAGVHDPAVQPFTFPWTDVTPDERARSVLRYHWSQRAGHLMAARHPVTPHTAPGL